MTPKIDYGLLGKAAESYRVRGYEYVEVPWAVHSRHIRATLPDEFDYMTIGRTEGDRVIKGLAHADYRRSGGNCLIGSAEQGFLALSLKPGAYFAITPCFRIEPDIDLTHQDMFMKLELFVTLPEADVDRVSCDAYEVMRLLGNQSIEIVDTAIGLDLEIAGIEVGSYGIRTHPDFGRWVYGTGLALPRFSVASALGSIC